MTVASIRCSISQCKTSNTGDISRGGPRNDSSRSRSRTRSSSSSCGRRSGNGSGSGRCWWWPLPPRRQQLLNFRDDDCWRCYCCCSQPTFVVRRLAFSVSPRGMVSQGMRGILVAGVVCGTGPCDDGSAMVARMEGPASGIFVTVVAFGVRLHKTCKRHRDAVAGKPGERRICDRCRFGALILTCSRGGMEATNTHTHGKKGF